jgi:ubiquinone/menaquinone biosynthesis C-methylase UbiE
MNDWEARDIRHAAQLLVGDYYGERPEEKLDMIRGEKEKRAAYLCKKLSCNKSSVALEIGSGMGLTSKPFAKAVKQLYCSDISESFLALARKECAGIANIEFVHIRSEPASFEFPDEFFDVIFSDAVFIHLNLYDIFWYFSEFQRLAKRRGRVFINIRNAARMDMNSFAQMAGFYRQNPATLKTLLCWNSLDAVIKIAANFGFRLQSAGRFRGLYKGPTVDLLFDKQ